MFLSQLVKLLAQDSTATPPRLDVDACSWILTASLLLAEDMQGACKGGMEFGCKNAEAVKKHIAKVAAKKKKAEEQPEEKELRRH